MPPGRLPSRQTDGGNDRRVSHVQGDRYSAKNPLKISPLEPISYPSIKKVQAEESVSDERRGFL